jgi:hypothetical protein
MKISELSETSTEDIIHTELWLDLQRN